MKIKLSNGFFIESDGHGKYYYWKPNVLANVIDKDVAKQLTGPIQTEVLLAIKKIDWAERYGEDIIRIHG